MAKTKFTLPALGLAAIAVAAIAATLIASTASAHKARHRPRAAAATSGSMAILNAFSVLRKPAASGGAPLPPSAESAASDESSQAAKIEPELTAEVKVQAQYPVWIASENGQLCLIQSGVVGPGVADSACGSYEEALAGKLIKFSTTPSGTPVIVGLAPNGNTSVQATEASGSSHALSVKENVYEIVGSAPHTITLHDANDQTTIAVVPGT